MDLESSLMPHENESQSTLAQTSRNDEMQHRFQRALSVIANLEHAASLAFNAEYSHNSEIKWTRTVICILTFNTSESFYKKLEIMTMEVSAQAADSYDWPSFMSYCGKDWTYTILASTILLFSVFYVVFPIFPVLAWASGGLAILSITTASTLLHISHIAHINSTSPPPFVIVSPSFKFQKTAFIFSLPRTSFIYGLLVFCSHWAALIYR